MKVSALLHAMDKDDEIVIESFEKSVTDMLYAGSVRGISRDSPINHMHVSCLCAINDTLHILAEEPKGRGTINERRKTN